MQTHRALGQPHVEGSSRKDNDRWRVGGYMIVSHTEDIPSTFMEGQAEQIRDRHNHMLGKGHAL
jgi:hypothetical protein